MTELTSSYQPIAQAYVIHIVYSVHGYRVENSEDGNISWVVYIVGK